MNINHNSAISTTLTGFYKVAILNSDNNIIWEQKDLQKNLILNYGLDNLYNRTICTSFEVAIAGSGSRSNSFTSSVATASVIGTNLFLFPSGSFTDFTSSAPGYSAIAELGDVVIFDDVNSTQMSVVSASTDGLGLLVTSSFTGIDRSDYTGVSGSFTIWKTSQTSLQSEMKRTSTRVSGLCGTTLSARSASAKQYNWRTWDFSAESTPVTYSEVGVSWTTSTTPNTTFSRMLLPTTLSLDVGQKMRLYYQLHTTISPMQPVSFSANVNGWPVAPATTTSGSQCILTLFSNRFPFGGVTQGMSSVTSTGTTAISGAVFEPITTAYGVFLSSTSSSLRAAGTGSQTNWCGDVTSADPLGALTRTPYGGSGSFSVLKYGTFTETQFAPQSRLAATGLGGLAAGYGVFGCGPDQCFFVSVFDQNQTKTDTQQLTLYWRFRWGRTIG